MTGVTLRNVRKTYPDGTQVLHGIDLEIKDGEFTVFVGPSGCGKTTLLRMIAGLEDITDGEIRIGDTLINDIPPAERGVAMVFQSYALYPHMTVAENMGFALKLAGKSKEEIKAAVGRAAEILQINPLLNRKPKALSGGQRQRVAIGRAIVRTPKVFLFDEPLSNLDAALRVQMRIELSKLHDELGATMIYVTHDQVEAMTMGDHIAVFDRGVIQQFGEPLELYRKPQSQFVGGFIGSPKMNFLTCHCKAVDNGMHAISIPGAPNFEYRFKGSATATGEVTLGMRPEDMRIGEVGQGIPVTVDLLEHLGDSVVVYAALGEGKQMITAKVPEVAAGLRHGDRISLLPRMDTLHVFAKDGRRISG